MLPLPSRERVWVRGRIVRKRIPLLNDRIGEETLMTMTRSEFGKVEVDIVYCVP